MKYSKSERKERKKLISLIKKEENISPKVLKHCSTDLLRRIHNLDHYDENESLGQKFNGCVYERLGIKNVKKDKGQEPGLWGALGFIGILAASFSVFAAVEIVDITFKILSVIGSIVLSTASCCFFVKAFHSSSKLSNSDASMLAATLEGLTTEFEINQGKSKVQVSTYSPTESPKCEQYAKNDEKLDVAPTTFEQQTDNKNL